MNIVYLMQRNMIFYWHQNYDAFSLKNFIEEKADPYGSHIMNHHDIKMSINGFSANLHKVNWHLTIWIISFPIS